MDWTDSAIEGAFYIGMKYFLHDSNAYNDEKITELFMNFGYEGLGLFYTLLEKLAFQEKPIKTTVLKKQLKVGKRLEKHWKFMEEIGLISSKNGETFNENILNFSEKYQIKKEKNRKKIAEWRDRKQDNENVTNYEPVRNQRKVKESKVKESKVKENKEYLLIFNEFRKLYPGIKRGNETEFANFIKKHSDWKEIINQLIEKINEQIRYREYLKSENQFVPPWKNLQTWINQRCWEEEILVIKEREYKPKYI